VVDEYDEPREAIIQVFVDGCAPTPARHSVTDLQEAGESQVSKVDRQCIEGNMLEYETEFTLPIDHETSSIRTAFWAMQIGFVMPLRMMCIEGEVNTA
jgi:hypothetical protein